MYYGDVIEGLNKGGVRYLVVGGVALVLHGVVRLTVDLDLMLDLSRENLVKFVSLMGGLGYKPKAPVDVMDFADQRKRSAWVRDKNMRVFSFFNLKNPVKIVDVFAENPLDFDKVYKNRKTVAAAGIAMPLVSLNDLKKLKKASGRSQDLADLKSIKELEELLKNETGVD